MTTVRSVERELDGIGRHRDVRIVPTECSGRPQGGGSEMGGPSSTCVWHALLALQLRVEHMRRRTQHSHRLTCAVQVHHQPL
jgi:hypothetical protein